MNTGLKLSAFAAALAATFGVAYGAGTVLDPVVADDRPAGHGGHTSDEGSNEGSTDDGGGGAGTGDAPAGGLQISEAGYTLALDTPRVPAGKPSELRFSILDNTGRKLKSYQREHDKELHFIVASRDLTVYRHLHPVRAADGTWKVRTQLPSAGGYRAFADFTPDRPGKAAAEGITLGADLAVTGLSNPKPLPAQAATAKVDGYEVRLTGGLSPAQARELKLTVTKDGKPVRDLQPYLGAYGHLVALRSGDLAYLHVHPNGEPGDGSTAPGPEVSFTATAPTAGAYRLFLDFKHEGEVRTAAFTVRVGGGGEAGGTGETGGAEESGAGEGGQHQH